VRKASSDAGDESILVSIPAVSMFHQVAARIRRYRPERIAANAARIHAASPATPISAIANGRLLSFAIVRYTPEASSFAANGESG